MPTYIALLRGINVSGQKRVPMQTLRGLHAGLGHTNVVTYIQSGNVVFDSDSSDPIGLARSIEAAISNEFGFEVSVVIRTPGQLATLLEGSPFVSDGSDPTRLGVVFLSDEPARGAGFDPEAYLPDRFEIRGHDIYLSCPGGFGKTKLTHAFFESRLGVAATTRNWRTVTKLVELSGSVRSD